MISVRRVDADEDLDGLVSQINRASWDAGNDMTTYHADALTAYLRREDTVFVVCLDVVDGAERLLGIASGRFEIKPYDRERWLYVDEVDVCADQRRRGAGKAMMRALLELAAEAGCTSVWLGTETDNDAAQALYRSLRPDDVERFVGFTWELGDDEAS